MKSRPWYRRKRTIKIVRSVEIVTLLGQLEGRHEPGPAEYTRVWKLATLLSLTAALYLPVIMSDLIRPAPINVPLFLLLGATVVVAVTLSFFLLCTHTQTYTLTPDEVTCEDRHGELLWSLSPADITEVHVHLLPTRRLSLSLQSRESNRQLPIHGHLSICEKVAPLVHSPPSDW